MKSRIWIKVDINPQFDIKATNDNTPKLKITKTKLHKFGSSKRNLMIFLDLEFDTTHTTDSLLKKLQD